MPTIDPKRPGYYTDGTPVPAGTQQAPQAGYPIGTNISASPTPDPAVTRRAMDIRAASGDTPAIQAVGNPYNAQGSRVTYRTADNKISDSSNKNAYAYYGVPTSTALAQGNEQYEFQEKLKQWEKEFKEKQKQSGFDNAVSAAEITRWAPSAITDMYPGWSSGSRYIGPSTSSSSSSVSLPATIANLYPGATNIVRDANGGYTFTSGSGVKQHYYGG